MDGDEPGGLPEGPSCWRARSPALSHVEDCFVADSRPALRARHSTATAPSTNPAPAHSVHPSEGSTRMSTRHAGQATRVGLSFGDDMDRYAGTVVGDQWILR